MIDKNITSLFLKLLKRFFLDRKWVLIITISVFMLANITAYWTMECLKISGDTVINICSNFGVLLSLIMLITYILPVGILEEITKNVSFLNDTGKVGTLIIINLFLLVFYYVIFSILVYLFRKLKNRKSKRDKNANH